MNYGKCKNCRWWEQRQDRSNTCYLMGSFGGDLQHPESKAYTCDAMFVRLDVFTEPDFGCIQFESKKKDNG